MFKINISFLQEMFEPSKNYLFPRIFYFLYMTEVDG